jgi:hypothetical protein
VTDVVEAGDVSKTNLVHFNALHFQLRQLPSSSLSGFCSKSQLFLPFFSIMYCFLISLRTNTSLVDLKLHGCGQALDGRIRILKLEKILSLTGFFFFPNFFLPFHFLENLKLFWVT